MAVFIDLWSCLLTTKLSLAQSEVTLLNLWSIMQGLLSSFSVLCNVLKQKDFSDTLGVGFP